MSLIDYHNLLHSIKTTIEKNVLKEIMNFSFIDKTMLRGSGIPAADYLFTSLPLFKQCNRPARH